MILFFVLVCVMLISIDFYILFDLFFRIEFIKLKFMMVNGKKEVGFIVSFGKDGFIKYWDIEW